MEIPGNLLTVSSDCKPCHAPFDCLGVCESCDHVQKIVSNIWQNQVKKIYAHYALYHLSNGDEQVAFSNNGKYAPRSKILLDNICSNLFVADKGRLLDIGCGQGNLLFQAQYKLPGWKLYGYEQQKRDEHSAIQNICDMYYGDIENIQGKFNIITLLHVLEHIPEPVEFLKKLHPLLAHDGYLIIQVPYFIDNPFDLIIYDHCSHFTPTTLGRLAELAGYTILQRTEPWLSKEIGIILQKKQNNDIMPNKKEEMKLQKNNYLETILGIDWLKQLHAQLLEIALRGDIAILGTSIAGTWLATNCPYEIEYFVDEDVSKIGKLHLGIPILSLDKLPSETIVLLPFRKAIAQPIFKRLSVLFPNLIFIIPEE